MRALRIVLMSAALCVASLYGAVGAQTVLPCEPCGKPPSKHVVIADGHPLTVWAKPASTRGAFCSCTVADGAHCRTSIFA